MERKIMVEVSEQELELIKNGIPIGEPKEPTLGKATTHSLLCELIKRIPEKDKEFKKQLNEKALDTICSFKGTTTYWVETPNDTEEEFSVTILLSTTGRERKKGE